MEGARKILLSITGGPDLSLWEINEAAKAVSEAAHPDANIIFGAMVDEKLGSEVWVTVVATGYPEARVRPARRDFEEPRGEVRVERRSRPPTTRQTGRDVAFVGADGERVVGEPPFAPLGVAVRGERAGYEPGPLLDHVRRERTVGVLLVRLGGHAAGVFKGEELTDSKVDSRLVHGRHRKSGSSSERFARRREGEARAALQAAADVAVRMLVPTMER